MHAGVQAMRPVGATARTAAWSTPAPAPRRAADRARADLHRHLAAQRPAQQHAARRQRGAARSSTCASKSARAGRPVAAAMAGQVDGPASAIARQRVAQRIEHAQVHAPAVQADQWQCAVPRRAGRAAPHAARGSCRGTRGAAHRLQRIEQSVDCPRRRCAAVSVTRSRSVPAGTVGLRMAATQKPRSQQRIGSRPGSAPHRGSSMGWMGVVDGISVMPRCAAPLRNRAIDASTRSRRQPCCCDHDPQRRARGRGHRRRQCRGEDVAARTLQDQLDDVARARHEGTEACRRPCPACPPAAALVLTSRPASSRLPRPVAPITPRPCASSTSSQACCRAREPRQFRQRRDVAIHAEHAVGGDEAHATFGRIACSSALRIGRVGMPIALQRRASESRAPSSSEAWLSRSCRTTSPRAASALITPTLAM